MPVPPMVEATEAERAPVRALAIAEATIKEKDELEGPEEVAMAADIVCARQPTIRQPRHLAWIKLR